ncbi:MAG: GGDEF domain-containing protein [Rhodoferax sp.]|nr:GGDEF domain-containing protein [Rhodoferax sp.]
MYQLINTLADLTSLRDRDALDIALVTAIQDVLQPESAAIYRMVGDADNERWLTSAQINGGTVMPVSEPGLDALPRLNTAPLRQQACTSQQPTQSSEAPWTTAFPLLGASGCRGVLEIHTAQALSEESCRVANGVLRLYVNFQSLLDYGERDALTELLNRKTFDGAFLKATVKQKRRVDALAENRNAETPAGNYWLAMIDIDHFKRVNDTFGHLIGDEVLLLLARLMRACFRHHDQLYRFGGEEFVALMRCESEIDAHGVLERLRDSTERHLFSQVGHITISIGFSEVMTGDSPSGAIERADKALYYAKGNGRNQVRSFAALVAAGDLTGQAAPTGEVELF